MFKGIITFSLSALALSAAPLYASTNSRHIVIAPACLIKNMSGNYQTLSSNKSLFLIDVNKEGIEQLIAAKEKSSKTPCGGFIDVTSKWNEHTAKQFITASKAQSFLATFADNNVATASNITYTIKHEQEVSQLLKQINPSNMWDHLTTLSNFEDRYADSDNGVKAANWLKTQIETIAKENNRDDVTTYLINTGSYKQPSVVVRIGNSSEAGIVIGAHMDTLSGTMSKKPGADDDGSGTVTALETARTVLSSGMRFKKPLYFIWYAAEEEGLVGSGYVVSEFKKKNIPIDAVLHFDLTGYAHNSESTMWLIDDNVNKDLEAYLEKLITTYVQKPVKHTRCGYACSDHANWTRNGYAAAIPAESAYEDTNPNIHSSRDTIDKLSLNHMTDYLKLATAFAVELAEPIAK